jgi:arginase
LKKICIVGVPSSAGARQTGQEQAPQSFRQAGLIEYLQLAGLKVTDRGDLAEVLFRPDQHHPNTQNLQLVVEVANRVANQVEGAVHDSALPIILGGDCTITLGVVAGLISHAPNLGLLYMDGDLDLNTPETTPSGIFDGMVIAHMTGKGVDTLARLGPRYPLMAEKDIVLFGYNIEANAIDAVEIELLEQSQMLKYPVSKIRGKAKESAREALNQLENEIDSILVHFDVDVIDYDDFPVGDVPHYEGLSFDDAISALEVFITSPKFAALVITEFNVNRDPDGTLAVRFVDAVVKTLKEIAD